VDGGASANNLLLQLQSDLSGLAIKRPACIESTALGAANLAAIGAGLCSSLDELRANASIEATFSPAIEGAARKARLARWHKAVERAKGWV
jgi:glycerol kinase